MDGQPAMSVTVELQKLQRLAVTDDHGDFIITHLPPLDDTLLISAVGSASIKLGVKLEKGSTIQIPAIRLLNNIPRLQPVEIIGREAHAYKSDYSFFGSKVQTAWVDIPQSISTVTKELIKDKMEYSLKDVADEVAGMNQYSGYDEYTIRGFRAENSRDINGLRGYNTTYTSPLLTNIERVEVIKGPTATLYGNCDPGGTINLVTKKPLAAREASLDLYQGSWGHFRAAGDVTGPLDSSHTLLFRLNGGYDDTRSFREQFFSKSYELAPSLTFIPNDRFRINLDFSLSHIQTVLDRGQPGVDGDPSLRSTPINLSLNQPGDYLHETDIASIVTLSYSINKHLSFNSGFLHYTTNQNTADHCFNSYLTPDSINLSYTTWNYHTVTNTVTNYFTYRANLGKTSHRLVAGYDYIRSKVNLDQQYYEDPDQYGVGSGIVGVLSLKNPGYIRPQTSKYQPSDFDADETDVDDNIYHTQGYYIQDEMSVGKWKLLLSLREEMYKGDVDDSAGDLSEHVFLPRVGVVYSLLPGVNLYATFNKGFDAFEASSSIQVFNAPFKPQISELIEAGAKGNFLSGNLSTSISLYRLTLLNVAVNANDPANPNLYIQQGQNRSQGVELEATGRILPSLSVVLSYAYCDARVNKSLLPSQVGMRVDNAPLNTSGSWIKYTLDRGWLRGIAIMAGHSQVGSRTTLDPSLVLPGYFIVNGGLQFNRYKHFVLALNVNNITGRTYWMGAYNNVNKWPGAPRNYMVSCGFRW
jgi:iron complex outermembrane receptor protein